MATADDEYCRNYFHTLELKQDIANKVSGSQPQGHAFTQKDNTLNICLTEMLLFLHDIASLSQFSVSLSFSYVEAYIFTALHTLNATRSSYEKAACLSVCLSVGLSVKRMMCDKMKERSVHIFPP